MTTSQQTTHPIVDGLDFLVSHFNEGFPRKISTKATKNVQIKVDNKEEALAWFRAADYLDCKMNAYPYVKRWKGWLGINRQVPDFLFVDLDLGVVKEIEALDKALHQTLKKINDKLGGYPTVLWSGHGYHIYQPVGAFILEEESEFAKFDQPSRGFIRFAEKYLSDNKADYCHYSTMSFNNCMIRIPGSYNAKSELIEVKIIQKWDGKRPSIKPLLFNCYLYLQAVKIKKLQHKHLPGEFCRYWKGRNK